LITTSLTFLPYKLAEILVVLVYYLFSVYALRAGLPVNGAAISRKLNHPFMCQFVWEKGQTYCNRLLIEFAIILTLFPYKLAEILVV
jgi:hypothetical protein